MDFLDERFLILRDSFAYGFAQESNEIEGIFGEVAHQNHKKALLKFLTHPVVRISYLEEFVRAIEPKAVLREHDYQAVIIAGNRGLHGTLVKSALRTLLDRIHDNKITCFEAHMEYEAIHPFMDGNGRSGRVLWLWQRIKYGAWPNLSFKHSFYYEAFGFYRRMRPMLK